MNEQPVVYRRHSLLKRNAGHTRAFFSSYYEHSHGPLASNQAGFRAFTTRYIQNHVEEPSDEATSPFDGVTMTTQTPRDDYSKGFFTHPDYVNVKDDEQFLFDLRKTISVLGVEETIVDGPRTRWKLLALMPKAHFVRDHFRGAARFTLNHLDAGSASALGFGRSSLGSDLLVEAWFDSSAARSSALEHLKGAAQTTLSPTVLAVREVEIFGPGNPWRVQ